MEGPKGVDAVTMRGVAASAGVTAMATYKHFKNRDALLYAAAGAEYPRIAGYFARANARTEVPGLRGMLGYLNYALDHPQVFRYMFSLHRADAFVFPNDLEGGKSPTFNVLLAIVSELMERRVLRSDDAAETALSIWAHAHGLITLYLCGRIAAPRLSFQKLYMRSLDRLLHGLVARAASAEPSRSLSARGTGQSAPMWVRRLEHVQLAMPAGGEPRAREFYGRGLGIPEVPKPPRLAERGGCWFERGDLKIHLGVESEFRPARKAHPALLIEDLELLVLTLRTLGYVVQDDEPLAGYNRVYVDDPFGNRIELMEAVACDTQF
jgi:AcrR family transcriptional regulator